jgi:hypothetical protein
VEVQVRVEGVAETVQEGDGAELRVARSGRAGASKRGADGAQQDAEHLAGEAGVVGQEGLDPLRQGELRLADGEWGQDMVGDVGGHFHHAPGVAGAADAATLAGEGDEALGGARVAADTGEAVGEDAAAQVGAEVGLHPARYTVAVGIQQVYQQAMQYRDRLNGRAVTSISHPSRGNGGGRITRLRRRDAARCASARQPASRNPDSIPTENRSIRRVAE